MRANAEAAEEAREHGEAAGDSAAETASQPVSPLEALVIDVAKAEALVTWEEVAVTLADAKMLALGARLAELRAKALELGLVRAKTLDPNGDDEHGVRAHLLQRRPPPRPIRSTAPTEAERADARDELRRLGYRVRNRGGR